MKNKGVIVVGGFPKPIGGVTNFINRLASNNMVKEVIDLYPSKDKIIPNNYEGSILNFSGIFTFFLFYIFNFKRWKGRLLHFNFSRSHSLLLFVFLPKLGSKFHLMLHHGRLNPFRISWLYRFALERIDIVYSMSQEQDDFYIKHDFPLNKIVRNSSYITPTIPSGFLKEKDEIDSFFSGSQVIVCSGRPDSIYNHIWNINYVKNKKHMKLALFLYGEGDCFEEVNKASKFSDNIKIFYDCGEDGFLYALSKAKLYSRPNKVDSFGIAVADAIELNRLVLASSVCDRYPGAKLFSPSSYVNFESAMDELISGEGGNLSSSRVSISKFKYDTSR